MNPFPRALPTLLLSLLLTALAFGPPGVSEAQENPPSRQLFQSDSLEIGTPVLSPDGRWIAFSAGTSPLQYNLWVIPAGGGEARRLTRGRYSDGDPAWAPDGRFLYFDSDRIAGPESARFHPMRIPFDSREGIASGPPRPISTAYLAGRGLAVSPSGDRVAFRSDGPDEPGRHRLLVTPAAGGRVTELLPTHDNVPIGWSGDGQFVYTTILGEGVDDQVLVRIPADGGEPEVVFEPDEPMRVGAYAPDGRRVIWSFPMEGGEMRFRVTDLTGRSVAELRSEYPNPYQFSLGPDGGTAYHAEPRAVSSLVVAPVAGGSAKVLADGAEYHIPMGWTSDGRVLFSTDDGIRSVDPRSGVVEDVPLDHGYPQAEGEIRHPSGRWLLFEVPGDDPEFSELVLADLEGGSSEVLTERLQAYGNTGNTDGIKGRGGAHALDGDRFLYLDCLDGTLSAMAVQPGESPRSLVDVGPCNRRMGGVAVHGTRVAWIEANADSTAFTLRLRDGATGADRSVLTTEAEIFDPTFSWDGRRLALGYMPRGSVDYDLAVVDLTADDATLNVRDAGGKWWWNPQWTPDDTRVLVVGMGFSAVTETDIWMVDVEGDAPPVSVTEAPDRQTWDFHLSPDGESVAYHLERTLGSVIRAYDLPDEGGAGRQ